MANLKQIKAKIKSVGNLKKITRALEVVSTVKLQKLKQQAEGLKGYLMQLLRIFATMHPHIELFTQEQQNTAATKTAVMVITSERGLCGGLNTKLLRKMVQENPIETTDFFVVGKKGVEFLKRMEASLVGHLQVGETFSSAELLALYTFFEQAIQQGTYKEVKLYFNFFKNSIVQIPVGINIFPLSLSEVQTFFAEVDLPREENAAVQIEDMLMEPSLEEIKTEMRRQIRNYIILSALVQNKTGEHAARMIAMKNAKDNATWFVKSLTLKFNKERQAAITKEISEIVSAKIAIEW